MTFTILHGNNLDILPTLPDNSVDSIVTDPPYELGFMGKKWDSSGIAYSVELWTECLRVLKPGGHLLSFGGTRTFHRVAVAIEDAGLEIRDNIAWLYGSGFPKSLDVSKAIDKAAGAERERVPYVGGIASGQNNYGGGGKIHLGSKVGDKPSTPEAQQWNGWGTALKPAHEPIIVARKPLEGTVAHNVLTHGTGALNIDGSRIGHNEPIKIMKAQNQESKGFGQSIGRSKETTELSAKGRFPANIILDEHTAGLLDEQSDASRFFYVAKASKRDRNEGLEDFDSVAVGSYVGNIGKQGNKIGAKPDVPNLEAKNFHPTVKPTALMEYLVKLVTPPNGTVLDPFTGSGSTGKAAILNGFDFIGIEMTEDYLPIIKGRLQHAETEFAKVQADGGLF
jgi:site-specific DNA-methyltransferase (adenine-specific)